MVYVILDKKLGTIYFTDTPRTEEEQETTELLYTTDSKTLDDIKRDLRPWICLDSGGDYYKNTPEIKDYIESGRMAGIYVRVYPSEVKSEISRFLRDYRILADLEILPFTDKELPDDFPEIIYDCDIYNYLETKFSEDVVETVYSYRSLGRDEKQFLEEFRKQGTRDRKLTYLKNNIQLLNPDVLEFLPGWYRLSLKVVGNKITQETPEYKNPESLGGDDTINLRDIFFDTFKLGETYTGQEIKEKIQFIYSGLGISKTPKISDLLEYFEVTSVSLKSSYRIDLRK